MTSSIAQNVDQRRTRTRELVTFAGDFRSQLLEAITYATTLRFPNPRYRDDPVAFFLEVLGVEPWHKQVEILEGVRDHKRVSVRSGHKVSKSHSAAGLALWFYCSFEDARVVMTSTTSRQVDQILWRELKMVFARSGWCVECKRENKRRLAENPVNPELIPKPCQHSALISQGPREVPRELARTGLKSQDFREIVGFTAKEAEAVAGVSGQNLLYIVDEASGVEQVIFEAIEGNRAGGARIVLFSNPTRNEGEHFDSFYSKKDLYHGITISSEETPNATTGRTIIPGLAGREWIEEKKQEWGEQSALYKIRVKGEHALAEDGKIFSVHDIGEAESRWIDAPERGRLYIGLDPAGPSGTGDETMFCARRGLKALKFVPHRGLDADQIGIALLALCNELCLPNERAVVVLDREGSVGAEVHGTLRALEEKLEAGGRCPYVLHAVRASDKAHRQQQVYDRMRDELAANLWDWMVREGGAIPEDAKLSAELHAPSWKPLPNGKQKITRKEDLRKMLGRSPDRFDSLCLAVWEPAAERETSEALEAAQSRSARAGAPATEDFDPVDHIDPYDGADVW